MGASKASDHSSADVGGGKNFVQKSVDELKKISTPTRAETIQATLVTIVIMTFVAICLVLLDIFFDFLMSNLLLN